MPDVAFAPLQPLAPPDAVQEVELVEPQVIVVVSPAFIGLGEAEMLAVGLAEVTLTVTS